MSDIKCFISKIIYYFQKIKSYCRICVGNVVLIVNLLKKIQNILGLYSQHFVFFVAYEQAQ